MKISYLTKKMLLGLIALILINISIFYIVPLAKYSYSLWYIVVFWLVFLFFFVKNRTNSYVLGKEGENIVDDELSKLGSKYICILKGLDTDKGNIDKIVISPTGVWILEIKNHKGNIIYDGQMLLRNNTPLEKNFLKQAYAEAIVLKNLIKSKLNLDIPVQPAVVFANKYAKVRLGLNKYKGVYVVQKEWLNKLLTETVINDLSQEVMLRIKNFILTS